MGITKMYIYICPKKNCFVHHKMVLVCHIKNGYVPQKKMLSYDIFVFIYYSPKWQNGILQKKKT